MHKQIETAFRSLTKVLLGQELQNTQSYSEWLQRDVRMPTSQKSALSSQVVYLSYFSLFQQTKKKVIKLDEAEKLGKKSISEDEAKKLSLSNAAKILSEIKLYSPESEVGDNVHVEGVAQHGYSSYCFNGDAFVYSKYCAYSMWPRSSEYAFGSDFVFSSKFCLKCFNSVNLSRCFEVSHSVSCSDCYFCHNCENLRECMFCFNTKNKSYAIGNAELGREDYLKVKKLILGQIAQKLEKDKSFPLSIYNIGCFSRKRMGRER